MLSKLRNAVRATLAHRRDPEDVACGVHYIDAIAQVFGRGDATMLRRMHETEKGTELLERRHAILDLLMDRERMRELPQGSVGRAYLEFIEVNGLDPQGLADVVALARTDTGGFVPDADEDVAYIHDRYRDLHDLWHVVSGYETDMAGEVGLLGLMAQQTGYRAMAVSGFITAAFVGLRGRPDVVRVWWDGWKRGRRAQYFLRQDWDRLVARPLSEVRRDLGFDPVPEYRPFSYGEESTAEAR